MEKPEVAEEKEGAGKKNDAQMSQHRNKKKKNSPDSTAGKNT